MNDTGPFARQPCGRPRRGNFPSAFSHDNPTDKLQSCFGAMGLDANCHATAAEKAPSSLAFADSVNCRG